MRKNPVLPKDNPEFRAMEQDIKERNARVQEKIRVSNSLKEQGNEAFRIGDYFKAVELYTNSIDTY